MGRASTPQNADNMLEAVWTIRQADKEALDLKRLEVCCAERNVHDMRSIHRPYELNWLMPLSRDAQLKLETLSISIGEHTPNQTLYEVLDSQATTLKTLATYNHKFSRFESPEYFQLQPPKMDCVTSLQLRGEHCPFPTFAFLKSFPALESLIFDFELYLNVELGSLLDATKDDMLLEGFPTFPTISKFHCSPGSGYGFVLIHFAPAQIRKLRRIMPNLTDLQMWLNNEAFGEVCGCWPGLQSLRIVGGGVDDGGLLGRIDRDGNVSANIRNLKELESFSMSHVGRNTHMVAVDLPVAVTGACVNPLLHLPKLKKLEIIGLDEECKGKHRRLQNTPVIRVEGREIHVKIRCAGEEDPLPERDQRDNEANEPSGDDSYFEGEGDDVENYKWWKGDDDDDDNESGDEDQSDEDEEGGDDGEGVKEQPEIIQQSEGSDEDERDASERQEDGAGVGDDAQFDSDGDSGGKKEEGESRDDGESDDDNESDAEDDDDDVEIFLLSLLRRRRGR